MKIVADEKIPLVKHFFGENNELILKNGRELVRADLLDADMLITRSVTKVNRALLEGTSVKFVGSVTSGADHCDTTWLDEAGITWRIAAGCNAVAVVEYVICVIAALQQMHFLTQEKKRAAVIGVGTIGSVVAEKLKLFGFEVILSDPLRRDADPLFSHTPLDAIHDCDLISLHTPLTTDGLYPTYHMIEQTFINAQKPNCVLLNAGRGAVINSNDLLLYGEKLLWCLDVWENEPLIDLALLENTLIATPHVAGHSIQSKYRAVQMIYDEALNTGFLTANDKPPIVYPTETLTLPHIHSVREILLSIYNPINTSRLLKKMIMEKGNQMFDVLRNQFNKNEFGFVELEELSLSPKDKHFLQELGIVKYRVD